jgi:small subunit ribosomal protein S17
MADEKNEQIEEMTEEPEAAETEIAEPEASVDPEDAGADAETPEEPEAEESAAEAEAAERIAEAEPAEEPAEVAEAEPAEEPTEPTEEPSEPQAEAEAPAAPARKKKRLPRSLRRQRTRPKREKPKARRPIVRLPKPEHARGRRQERQGTVVSAATDKTIVVRVDTVKMHPRYKKVIRRSTRLHAHDEQNQAKVGDVVEIVETRPLSKLKRWRLQRVVEAAK